MRDETRICNRIESWCLKVLRDFKHIQSRKKLFEDPRNREGKREPPVQQVRLISLPGKIR